MFMNKGAKIGIIIGSIALVLGVGAAIAVPLIIKSIDQPNAPTIDHNKTTVACIGDSITYGHGVWFTRDRDSYPALLEKELGSTYQSLNYGLSGRTLLNEGDRPYAKEDFYKISHDAKADIYIIMLGTNDSKPFNWDKSQNGSLYKSELKAFVSSYMDLDNSPTVYLLQPPKAFPDSKTGTIAFSIDDNVIKNEIRHLVSEVATELGILSIDLYGLTESHPEWFPDGVHPNSNGNLAIAKQIASAMKKVPN